MNNKALLELQSKRGARVGVADATIETTIDDVINKCRKALEERSAEYRDLGVEEKQSVIKKIITDYIMNKKPMVRGYIISDVVPDVVGLLDTVIEAITDYDFLTEAIRDESITEIRGNGKEIKIERGGRVSDLVDSKGHILSFRSTEQQDVILKKLLQDVRLTKSNAVVNATTLEGYRLAAVDSSATGADPDDPLGDKYAAFVLRKFNKKKMSLGEIVKFGTMSDNMARTLIAIALSNSTLVTVGPTDSGKTTTNNAYLNAIKARKVIIQNPSEIDGRIKDATGRVINDVLHLEARDIENPRPEDPTPENLMDQSLRLSPAYMVFGELRKDIEFAYGVKLVLAGHPFNATYHSDSVEAALNRYVVAYAQASGLSEELAKKVITTQVNFIMVQHKLEDGSRKVLELAEVIGLNSDGSYNINMLYEFMPTEAEYDENDELVKINGIHRRVGKISDRIIKRLGLHGVKRSRYDFLTKEVNKEAPEEETYTGEGIEKYGTKKGGM